MSKRLQVVVEEGEWSQFQEAAHRHGMTASSWVRSTLREAQRRQPAGDLSVKLQVVRTAAQHAFPTADIDQMLDEVERGYESPPVSE